MGWLREMSWFREKRKKREKRENRRRHERTEPSLSNHSLPNPPLPDHPVPSSSPGRTLPLVVAENQGEETTSQLTNHPSRVPEHTATPLGHLETEHPTRPATRLGFEIAIVCALTLEADAVEALFDQHWNGDNGTPYDKVTGDTNAYTTGSIGRHNVVLAHMPGMGKANAAAVAANCRASFPNIKLAIVAGVCGAVPFYPNNNKEIILGDVIISTGVIQYDLGRRHNDRFIRKDTLLDSLGRPNTEIRALLAKLEGRTSRRELQKKIATYLEVAQRDPELEAGYPGVGNDRLFKANYLHVPKGKASGDCGCTGPLVRRERLQQDIPRPSVHFGFIASGDTVMRSGEHRDDIARQERVLGFDMEGAGVWDNFPCIVIKGACDYADSHKTKLWQAYAAASAAGCVKGFLEFWVPSMSSTPEPRSIKKQSTRSWFLVPYPRNNNFVGRTAILEKLQQLPLKSTYQTRASLFGLGGVGKTQIAIEYAYWLRDKYPDMSVFWVRASSADQFRQSFHSIALECGIPSHNDPKSDVLPLVKRWLERNDQGLWTMIIDNADDAQLFFSTQPDSTHSSSNSRNDSLSKYIPECSRGSIFVTTRNKQVGIRLTKGMLPIEICKMDDDESQQLLRSKLGEEVTTPTNLLALSSQLEHLPLALVQASAFIQENSITVDAYLELLDKSDQHLINLLSEEFETVGRDSGVTHAVAATWSLSFEQIECQNALASELLSLMSLFDRQGIPMEFLSDFIEWREGHPRQENIQNLQLIKALGVLKAYSLVTEKGNDFDMHRLVQLVTQKWLVTKETMSRFAREALLTVSRCYPYSEHETRERCTAYLPHVQAVLMLKQPRSMEKGIERANILHSAGSHFSFQGQWKRAEEFQTEAAEIYKRMHGPDHPNTLSSMNNLATLYQRQGRLDEAELLLTKALEKKEIVLGPDHPDTLTSMGNLAMIYIRQGRLDEAELLHTKALEKREIVLGPENPDTLSSMNNLAMIYIHQGRLDEAELLHTKALEKQEIVLGPDHPDTLTSMNNLAHVWKSQGRIDDAIHLMGKCVEGRNRILPRDHSHTVSSRSCLDDWRAELATAEQS